MQKEKNEPTTTTSATTTTKSTTTTTTDTTERYSKLKIINSDSCKKKIFLRILGNMIVFTISII